MEGTPSPRVRSGRQTEQLCCAAGRRIGGGRYQGNERGKSSRGGQDFPGPLTRGDTPLESLRFECASRFLWTRPGRGQPSLVRPKAAATISSGRSQGDAKMSWTDERVDQLKSLWTEGLAASQLARVLGGGPPHAVIGQAHRLGLAARAVRAGVARPRLPRRRGFRSAPMWSSRP